jgi:hypothetical protein
VTDQLAVDFGVWCELWCDAVLTWCGFVLCEADVWCVCDLWGSALEVAAATGEAVKAATGSMRPSRAYRGLREVVTGLSSKGKRCGTG